MISEQFKIKSSTFEGPLDLLLSLIEKRKMHISDVSLSSITEEYIRHIAEHPIPIAHTAEFILVASTLMLIKSRSLLPGFMPTPEEEGDIAELERRIAHYALIQKGAAALAQHLGKARLYFRTVTTRPEVVQFRPGKQGAELTRELHLTMSRLAALMPTQDTIPQTKVQKTIRLEEVMHSLLERVSRSLRTSLREFSGGEKSSVILGFLAILELIKQGSLTAEQSDHFAEIHLETLSFGVPRYDHA